MNRSLYLILGLGTIALISAFSDSGIRMPKPEPKTTSMSAPMCGHHAMTINLPISGSGKKG